ncbi:DNAJ protein JJJ1 homolog [Mangifera indica]|uniref:DNAJ protein JJJ1 homolog n=1 Tax=Mangifera indica TaxID=29780 RepID=UPI001CFA0481|nr:DNAJ protein JJJ1 homolog [Mangifera indica]
MASEKRCLYEVLDLSKDCSPDEIRSAYKKLALQRHPDKLVQSGLTHEQATAQFQELVNAYEVLSDPKERAWYDSHRSQILFSDLNSSSNSGPNSVVPNLFSYFSNTAFSGYSDSGTGFYKVYSDLFDKVFRNEINFVKKLGLGLDSVREAPIMGNLESPYSQVTAFYNYWLGFSTVMDFCWVDQYDVMAGPNRKSRRVMEEENKKLRKKAKREYNETVRGLAEFVKKRDKRVIDMAVKKNKERERKKEEEREKRKKLERERLEQASRYEEPEWARIDDDGENDAGFEEEVEENENKRNEFYCVVCGKKFKSEKQWRNHEQSKKHKEKVAELRESFVDEDEDDERDDFDDLDGEMEELGDMFKASLGIEEREVKNGVGGFSGDDDDEEIEFFDVENSDEVNGIAEGFQDADDDENEDEEFIMLKAMVSGLKTRKKVALKREDEVSEPQLHVENVIDEDEVMDYDNRKSTRRKAKKERGRKSTGEATKSDKNGTKGGNEQANAHDNSHMGEESTSQPFMENVNNGTRDDQSGTYVNTSDQPVDRNGMVKEKKAKSKNSSKGKKAKATSKNSSNLCERCGEEFESRNKLHKHLSDTGHASLKLR